MAKDRKLSLILGAKDRLSNVLVGCANKSDAAFKKLQNRIKGVATGFDKVGKSSMKAGTMLIGTVAAGIGVVTKGATMAASAGDKIDKLSQKIGMSRKSYQEWDYIMSQNGGNVDGLTMGYKTLETQIEAVIKGSKSQTALFRNLGISVRGANGQIRSQEAIFNSAVKAIQRIQNPTKKAIYANQLFGRSAIDLRPLLNQTSESVDKLRKKAHDLGFVMNDDDVDAAVKLTDTMDTLKRVSGGMFRQIGVQLIPVVQRFSDKIIENAPRIKSEVLPVISKLVNGLSWAVEHLSGTGLVIGGTMVAFGGLSVAIGKTLDSFVSIGTGIRNFHKFMEVHRFTAEVKAIRMISGVFTQLGTAIMATPVGWLAAGVAAIVVGAVLIRKYWTPITQLFKGIWEGIKTSLKPAFDSVGEALKPLNPLFQTVGKWISNAWNWFTKLIAPVNTTGKASHDLGVKIGEVIGGFIKLGARFVWFLARINPITGPLIAIWQNFDKIKNAITGAGNALKNFFSKFGNRKITASVSVDDKVSGKEVKKVVDGSHANGLRDVPFDGYTAELHKHERVLTAQENKQYNSSTNTPIYVTFSPVINADSNTDTSSIAKIVERECNKLIAKIQEQQRRRLADAYA